jgi:arylsulfatase A-like enzyme
LYRETQQVPLIFIPPFDLDPGIVVNSQVANVDIFPTILDLLGLPPLPASEGISLVPEILAAAKDEGRRGQVRSGDRAVYSQLDTTWGRSFGEVGENTIPHVAMVKGEHRLVYHESQPNRTELYDHREDFRERRNIAAEKPDLTKQLTAEVQEFLAKPNEIWDETPEVELDEMRLHQLRALGYFVEGPQKGGMRPLGEILEDDVKARVGNRPRGVETPAEQEPETATETP